MARAILFDLGNVLIDFDHRRAASRICAFTKKSPEEIFDLFFDSTLTGLFEEGKVSALEFFGEVKDLLGLAIDYQQFVPIWNEIFHFSEKNYGVYRLACQLKKKFKFAVLSNINILHLEYIRRVFPLLNHLPIITSYEEGFRKPHLESYKKALQKLGAWPQDVFYTDDRQELVEAAQQLGLRGFVFKGVEGLQKDLIQSGIPIS